MNEIMESKDKYLVTENTLQLTQQIYAYCVAMTPQVFKKKTKDEMKIEMAVIENSIKEIPPAIVKKMCELAINKYNKEKQQNPKLIFDISYILEQYVGAEYLVRNDLDDFESVFDNLDDVEI